MKITSVETEGLGPLGPLSWTPGTCEVIYDDNQQGKTTLIDIVINTLFKERMKLFESRYDSYEGCQIRVDIEGAQHTFGDNGDTDRLSDLLDWDMPELHRFLCIRASDLTLSRPLSNKGPEEIWKALSSVMSGMDQEYLEGIRSGIRNKAAVTKSLKWSNRKPERLKDRIIEDVVPDLERAERAEDRLRELMECRRKRREARATRDEYRKKLSSIEQDFERIERKRVRAELDRADQILGEVGALRNEIDDRFGDRVTESFREPWRKTISDYQDVEERLEQWEQAQSLRNKIGQLDAELDDLVEELEGARDTFAQKKEQFLDTRRNEVRPLHREYSETMASKQQWLPILEWSTPGMGLSGALLVVGLGISVVEWIPGLIIAAGGLLGLVALVGLVAYRRSLDSTLERCHRQIEDYAQRWPDVTGEDPADVLETLMDASPEAVYPDLSDRIGSLENKKQQLEGEKNAHVNSFEDCLSDLDETEAKESPGLIEQRIDELQGKRDELESDREEFRRKTGVPDYEEFIEQLEERSNLENEVQQKMVKLRTLLDLDDAENLGVVRSTVERRLEEYSDVSLSGESPDELKEQEQTLEERRREAEKQLEDAESTIESLEETERSISSELSEIGIPFDEPRELFEQVHEWEQELEEAVKDRLAAALCLNVLDQMEGDYMGEIRRLLGSEREDDWSINSLYRSVMGDQYDVDFDMENLAFNVEADGTTVGESHLSSGARSHLYLSCRLAVLRQLFPDEPGFMILDDPFLHYFPDRKEKVIDELARMVEDGWQVLLFTVDPSSRDYFREYLDATVHSVAELEHDLEEDDPSDPAESGESGDGS